MGNQLGSSKTAQERTIPMPMEIKHTIPEEITQVHCGLKHNIFLTASGEIFASGNNSQSQLGQEILFHSNLSKPLPIPALKGLEIDRVYAGSTFTYAVSKKTGEVWAWGYAPD